MSDSTVESLAARAAALSAAVERGQEDGSARERVRAELISLGREIDARIAELEALKGSLRPVADRYRQLYRQAPPPLPRRRDHLGGASYRERGWSALAAGDYAGAAQSLRRALEADSEDTRAMAMLGWAYLLGGQREMAVAVVEELEEMDPVPWLGSLVIGYAQLVYGDAMDAVESLVRVAENREDATAALYAQLYVGVGMGRLGNARAAQASFRRALELGPNLTEALWELGRSHLEEGRFDLAREAWRTGAEDRFTLWGERCRAAWRDLEAGRRFG